MTSSEALAGFFSGFEGHNAPTSDDINDALSRRDLLISIDANVLLGLYRLSDERSASLRRGLREHAASLFLSHQAQVEFWRNRESVLSDRARAREEAIKALNNASETARNGLRNWSKAVSIDEEDLTQALLQVDRQFAILKSVVDDQHEDDSFNYPSPGDDPIVQELVELFAGRVGAPDEESARKQNIAEGKRRHAASEPPGYKEKEANKQGHPEGVAGDYLVWRQSINEAKHRDADLLIVTADEKEDWYWKVRGAPVGARHELAFEFYQETGRKLFMLTPLQLDARWRALEGEGEPESRPVVAPAAGDLVDGDAANNLDAFVPVATLVPVGEWNEAGVHTLLELLSLQAPVQADVIHDAAQSGGSIERDRLYEIAGYPPDRMLRGFTRPVRRLTRLLQERGDLPLGVPDFLVARYDYSVEANAFELDPEVVPWVLSFEPPE